MNLPGSAATGTAPTPWAVRVPASSANLGPGFDVLGMALDLHAFVGVGDPPTRSRTVDEHHPAMVAYRSLGGTDQLWVYSPIPAARGLGFSGAMRVGGAAAALAEKAAGGIDAAAVLRSDEAMAAVLDCAVALEGHADNAAASLYGGIVIAADGTVTRVPTALDPVVVAWIPDAVVTSTDRSRTLLGDTVPRSDAVFNLGRVAMLVAAFATNRAEGLAAAFQDRLHQPERLAGLPASADAIGSALAAGADAAWLSGSGPTVAMMCLDNQADAVIAALPRSGHVKQLRIDTEGARVVGYGELPHA